MMSFHRTLPEKPIIVENFQGGKGSLKMQPILNSRQEMYDKGRVFGLMTLTKGDEIGRHTHHGDGETFYILKGKGKYLYQGQLIDVFPGDVLFTDDGEEHYMRNEQEEPLVFIALVLFKDAAPPEK